MSGTSPVKASPLETVCVVGSGGREHALALGIGRTADVVVTPGNPGIKGRTPRVTLFSLSISRPKR